MGIFVLLARAYLYSLCMGHCCCCCFFFIFVYYRTIVPHFSLMCVTESIFIISVHVYNWVHGDDGGKVRNSGIYDFGLSIKNTWRSGASHQWKGWEGEKLVSKYQMKWKSESETIKWYWWMKRRKWHMNYNNSTREMDNQRYCFHLNATAREKERTS